MFNTSIEENGGMRIDLGPFSPTKQKIAAEGFEKVLKQIGSISITNLTTRTGFKEKADNPDDPNKISSFVQPFRDPEEDTRSAANISFQKKVLKDFQQLVEINRMSKRIQRRPNRKQTLWLSKNGHLV